MVIKNKKNGTNVLAFKSGIQNIRVIFKAGETVDIKSLIEFNQIINKADFVNRNWFEIIEVKAKVEEIIEEDSSLEKAKKEVKKYTSEN